MESYNFLDESNIILPDVKESLQRTAEWFEQRRGIFTGSKIKDLMGCTRSSTKLTWREPEKLIDLGETAIKYIYSRAMERKHGYIVQSQSSAAMKYGTRIEPEIAAAVKGKYPTFKEVGFITHPKYPFLGASADGETDTMCVELKASTSWDTLYTRHEVAFDHKHQDFWQINTECLCIGKNKCLYVVALPPENIFDAEIINGFSERIVDASEMHQRAIINRARLGELIIERYLSGVDKYFLSSVEFGCSNIELI